MLYKKGRYRVEVGDDGAIKVKKGDCLSKYSAAIYDDFTRVDAFARMDESGSELPIQNVDAIQVGETIYHLPTYYRSLGKRLVVARPAVVSGRSAPPAPTLSDDEKKKVIIEILKKDLNLRGERLTLLSKAATITTSAITLAGVAELIATSPVSLASPILTFIFDVVHILNAWEFGQRLTGMRAVAFGATAWAFDDPTPPFPAVLHDNILRAYGTGHIGQTDLELHETAWRTSRDSVVQSLEKEVAKRNVSKTSYQVLLRAVGNDSRKALVKEIKKGLEKRLLIGSRRDALWDTELEYPN